MTTARRPYSRPPEPAALHRILLAGGSLNELSEFERLDYYLATCSLLRLNPMTLPFAFIDFDGKLQLYATKRCTQQLARMYGVSITKVESFEHDLVLSHIVYARLPDGREDVDIGSVDITGLKGLDLANARMRSLTKARRRVVLSILGLGMLDESELDTMPAARVRQVDPSKLPSGNGLHARGNGSSGSNLSRAALDPGGPMTRAQMDDLTRILNVVGFERKEDARRFMEFLVGRSLETNRLLTVTEAAKILTQLGTYDEHGYRPNEDAIRSAYQAFVESRKGDVN